jgi:hypothetical protein
MENLHHRKYSLIIPFISVNILNDDAFGVEFLLAYGIKKARSRRGWVTGPLKVGNVSPHCGYTIVPEYQKSRILAREGKCTIIWADACLSG